MMTIEPGNDLERYLCDQAYQNRIPISGTFELLPICNMNCKMCYIRITPEEMRQNGTLLEVEEWLRIAEEARKKGLLFVLLTGGEPLLYHDFKRLYRGLRKLGMIVTINTNGTLIDDDIVDLLHTDLPRRVNVSLYGSNNRIYETLCQTPNGYTQTINGIKKLQEAGVPVKINYTLSKLNYSDLNSMAALSEKLGLPISMPTYMFPPARRENLSLASEEFCRMSAKEAALTQINILDRTYGMNSDYAEMLQGIIDEIKEKPDHIMKEPPRGYLCSAGVSTFWVNWRGEMTACGMMSKPSKNVRQESFEIAWKEIQEETQKVLTSKKCYNCRFRKYCHTCPASAVAETGKINEPGSYNCEFSAEYERLLRHRVKDLQTGK